MRNVFDAGRYITWESGRGLGPGNGEFFGSCEMASEPIGECHLGTKNLELFHIKFPKQAEITVP